MSAESYTHTVQLALCRPDEWQVRCTYGDESWTLPVLGWAVVAQTMRDGCTDTRFEPVVLDAGTALTLDQYLGYTDDMKRSDCKLARVGTP